MWEILKLNTKALFMTLFFIGAACLLQWRLGLHAEQLIIGSALFLACRAEVASK